MTIPLVIWCLSAYMSKSSRSVTFDDVVENIPACILQQHLINIAEEIRFVAYHGTKTEIEESHKLYEKFANCIMVDDTNDDSNVIQHESHVSNEVVDSDNVDF